MLQMLFPDLLSWNENFEYSLSKLSALQSEYAFLQGMNSLKLTRFSMKDWYVMYWQRSIGCSGFTAIILKRATAFS